MVLLNGQKFACQSCIKGHRSSSCNHKDRPLFEIRKKGRPVSQCDACRHLRRTKKLHVKCLCDGRRDPEADIGPVEIQSPCASSGKTVGRKIPLIPTLPNGIKDLQSIPSPTTEDAMSISKLASIPEAHAKRPSPSPVEEQTCAPVRSCCSRKPTTGSVPKTAASSHANVTPGAIPSPGFQSGLVLQTQPAVEYMECLCGPGCQCVGCAQHNQGDSESMVHDGMSCPVDCPSCVDNTHGAAWPSSFAHPSSNGSSMYGSMPNTFTFHQDMSVDQLPLSLDVDLSNLGVMSSWDAQAIWSALTETSGDDIDADGSPNPDYIPLPEEGVLRATIPKNTSSVSAIAENNSRPLACCVTKTCCDTPHSKEERPPQRQHSRRLRL